MSFERFNELQGLLIGFVCVIGAEFSEQNATTIGEQVEIGCSLPFQTINDASFKSFEPNRLEQDLKLFDVIDRLAAQQRMRAAAIVANHPADCAAIVG